MIIECTMCFDHGQVDLPLSNDQIELLPPTQGCNHDRNICDPCLQSMWENEIKHGNTSLTCPAPECRAEVSPQAVRRVVSGEWFTTSVSFTDMLRCVIKPWANKNV
jgi:hypothetical protein